MAPKEKAIELYTKFNDLYIGINLNIARKHWAKQSALIAANEAIDEWEYIDIYISNLGGELNTNLRYWYEVKEEIIRL